MFVEFKAERGRATREQMDWLEALDGCGVEVYVWKPSQQDLIARILR